MSTISQIPGLGGRKDFVAPAGELDRVRLSDDEQRVLALVGNAARIGDVLDRAGMDEQRAASALLSLRVKGLIVPFQAPARTPAGGQPAASPVSGPRPVAGPPLGAAPTSPSGSRPAAGPSPSGPRLSAQAMEAALAEPVDLQPDVKREILELDLSLPQKSHFEVLGLELGATADDVRRAFHAASRKFHPDRYFGRNLGSFKARLERIFLRLSEASTVLSDPQRRAAYLEANPALAARKAESDAEAEARAAERRARMARHPYLLHARRGNDLLAEARAALEQGELSRAQTTLASVLQVDPRNKDAPELQREIRRRQEAQRAQNELEKGKRLEAEARYDQAALAYRNASNADPQDAHTAAKAAFVMLQAGEDAKQAKLFAQRAVDLAPRNVSFRLLLGRALAAADMKKLAKKEYEKALELEPDNAEAREQLRKLRWPF